METTKAKEPQPDELRKVIRDSLAANGFSNLEVWVDKGKGVAISGNVRHASQKNKIIKIVNAMGLSVPADYSTLQVMKGIVAETVKKSDRKPPQHPQIREASPKPASPEAPRKPLPPRLDRGNIQF